VLRTVLTCQRSLIHYGFFDETDPTTDYAADMIQTLADAFCASIPSHLGNKNSTVPPDRLEGVEFPHLTARDENGLKALPPNAIGYSVQMSKEEHYRLAAAIGGWYVLIPLGDILKATAPTAKDIELGFPPLLREGQTEWIFAQLERLKKIYLLQFPGSTTT
jgi:hypothetical protein